MVRTLDKTGISGGLLFRRKLPYFSGLTSFGLEGIDPRPSKLHTKKIHWRAFPLAKFCDFSYYTYIVAEIAGMGRIFLPFQGA